MTNFTDFGLSAPILKALEGEGYVTPTPIQIQAIPLVLEGRDLQGIAQTGTGKTAAFALPILDHFSREAKPTQRRGCRSLILSPTRELTSQIADNIRTYGRFLRLSTLVVFGGVPINRQIKALERGVDILVATPGRLLDLIDRRALTLEHVEILVLDEADQMLDLGFIHALRRVVKLVPKERQTLFFSATMPKTIATLADDFLTNPAKVAVKPSATTAERVNQQVMYVSTGQKQGLLAHVLNNEPIERALVFTRTKHGADRVVKLLARDNIVAAAIHGNKSQGQRERALAEFRTGACRVLIATDIAARGIDVDGVSHVINFELPNVPESYVHRIGRTARAGADGIAMSFCNGEERAYLRDIQRTTRQDIPVVALPKGFTPEPENAGQLAKPAGKPGGGRNPGGRPGGRPQGAEGRNAGKPRRFGGQGRQGEGGGRRFGGEGRAGAR
ncbi:MAG: DEAD/DEAH box helicase [Salinarimonadaceae bacterium]|nr:MAG: DEAD/DEAH box helicase [Salinarimonadaceae bacterium]